MDSYDQINELVTVLQKFRDIQNTLNNTNLPAITPRDVIEMVNENPKSLQEVINLARESPNTMGYTDSIPDDFTANYVEELSADWRFLPSDYNLFDGDYNTIVRYFRGEDSYSQLNAKQKGLLKSLTYEADDFSVDSGLFNFEHEAINSLNLREQLLGKLERDNILTKKMSSEIFNSWDEFPEDFSYFKVSGAQVPGFASSGNTQIPQQGVELQGLPPHPIKQELKSLQAWAKRIVNEIRMPKEEAVRAWVKQNGYSLDEDEFEELFEEVEDQMLYKAHETILGGDDPKPDEIEMQQINESEFLEEKDEAVGRYSAPEPPPDKVGNAEELAFWRQQQDALTQITKNMVYENPEMTGEQVFRKFQNIPDGVSIEDSIRAGGRNADSYGWYRQLIDDEIILRDSGEGSWKEIPTAEIDLADVGEVGRMQNPDGSFKKPVAEMTDQEVIDQLSNENAKGIRTFEPDYFENLSDVEKEAYKRNLIEFTEEEKANLIKRIARDEGSDWTDIVGVNSNGEMISQMGPFTEWLGKQLIGLPLVGLLNQFTTAVFGPTTTAVMNWGMGALGLLHGDPTGLIIQGVTELTKELDFQHQRDVDNDNPASFKYSHFGYVRDTHDGKWYPGYVNSMTHDAPTVGGRGNTMQMVYGDTLNVFKDKFFFDDPKYKTLELFDNEFNGETYYTTPDVTRLGGYDIKNTSQTDERPESYNYDSFDWVQNADITRDWFFIPQDQVNTWLQGDLEGFPIAPFEDAPGEGVNRNEYTKQISDWQRVMQIQKESGWYWDDLISPKIDERDKEILTDIGLRRGWREAGQEYADSLWTNRDWSMDDIRTLIDDHGFDQHVLPENQVLLDEILRNSIDSLVRSQKNAADDQGYEQFASMWDDDAVEKGKSNWQADYSLQYLDPYDIPTASSAQQLQEQIDGILQMDDRTKEQMDYLINRSSVRYWLGQANSRNGLGNVAEYMLLDDYDPGHKLPRYGSVAKTSMGKGKMPWALASDDDFFPDDLNYSDELTEKWDGRYDAWTPKPLPWDPRWDFVENDRQTRVWGEATGTGGWEEDDTDKIDKDADRVAETTDDYGWDYEEPAEDDPGVSLEDIMDENWDTGLDWGFAGGDDYTPPTYEYLEPDAPDPDDKFETKPTATIVETPPQPSGLPAPVLDKPKEVPHLSQFGNFLLHEHLDEFQDLVQGDISEEELRAQYPFGSAGNLVIGGDDELEKQLGLPDEIRAVEIGDEIKQTYDPYQVHFPQLGGSIYNSFHTVIS